MEVAPRYRLLTLLTLFNLLTLLTFFTLLTLLTLALCMNTEFYFDCLGHQELKNIAHKGLWKVYAVTWSDGTGRIISLRLLQLLKHLRC